ncbi:hypothetical protein M514_19018 [Trichuris suis]|uniref:Uncharacterized protein n=1 Tax=Trichuris suis TaxID=68888 RepID=A0A085NH31_9BILA|nr:hypothetical protein M514_19018 [Trichuris suis]
MENRIKPCHRPATKAWKEKFNRKACTKQHLDTSAEGNERKVDHGESSTYETPIGQTTCRAMTTVHLPLPHKSCQQNKS